MRGSGKTRTHAGDQACAPWATIACVAIAVGVATTHVWSKVEGADIAHRTSIARDRVELLQEERSRLAASVVMKTKPGIIKRLAESRLMMIDAADATTGGDYAIAAEG